MTDLFVKHCSVLKALRKTKPTTPWFDAYCRVARRSARAAERRFRRTRSDVDRSNWTASLKTMHSRYERKNDDFSRTEIAANAGVTGNTKRL